MLEKGIELKDLHTPEQTPQPVDETLTTNQEDSDESDQESVKVEGKGMLEQIAFLEDQQNRKNLGISQKQAKSK